MEEQYNQESIYILTQRSEKDAWEQQLRFLWQTCFGDSQQYEDFYFETVYTNNKVYVMPGKGMIHVNFYRCKVLGKTMELPYIVGVATDKVYRRQGVMRRLLTKVLEDLNQQGIPFAYLMPANTAYYEAFGFTSISEKSEYAISLQDSDHTDRFRYLSYRDVNKLSSEMQITLRDEINGWLQQRYDVYAIHDEAYFDLLYKEKACQNGNVIFCFDGVVDVGHFAGMFAYAMDGENPYVEQLLMKEKKLEEQKIITSMLGSFFTKCDEVKVVQSYPYMLRTVNNDVFLDVFKERLSDILIMSVTDGLVGKDMIEHLFVDKDCIYFAEIV